MSAGRKINCVQIQFFVQWRRNSGIVEAIAEHDFRPQEVRRNGLHNLNLNTIYFPLGVPSPNVSPSKKGEKMLNYLWSGMILIGIFLSTFSGKMSDITTAALDSSKEAVTLCITMMGVMSFWTGLMEIAEKSGILKTAADRLSPLIHFLFPELPKNHPAEKPIAANIIANVLGLGWAATPAGLEAMEELQKLEEDRHLGKAAGPVRKKRRCKQ